ncbi:hypothetical protein EGW08_006042, partial [Elysia chlorotica]
AGPNENCGPQPQTLLPDQIKGLGEKSGKEYRVYLNDQLNKTSPGDPGCATFVYIPSGSSRSLSTPATLASMTSCSIVLVTDENSTLTLRANYSCNARCSCRDTLALHNSLLSASAPPGTASLVTTSSGTASLVTTPSPPPKSVAACLNASDDGPELVVTSGEGGYLVLELAQEVTSLASYSVTVESSPNSSAASQGSPASDALVKDDNSDWTEFTCYRPQSYVPSCSPSNATNGGTTTDASVAMETKQTVTTGLNKGSTTSNNITDSALNTTTTTIRTTTTSSLYNTDNINHTSATNSSNNNNINNYNNNNNNTNSNNNNNNNNNNNKSSSSSSSLSPGIIAGVVVACLLALSLVAVLIYFASCRHRGSRVQPGFPSGTDRVLASSAPTATTVRVVPRGTTAI